MNTVCLKAKIAVLKAGITLLKVGNPNHSKDGKFSSGDHALDPSDRVGQYMRIKDINARQPGKFSELMGTRRALHTPSGEVGSISEFSSNPNTGGTEYYFHPKGGRGRYVSEYDLQSLPASVSPKTGIDRKTGINHRKVK